MIELSLGLAATRPKPLVNGTKSGFDHTSEGLARIMQEECDALTEEERQRTQMSKLLHTKVRRRSSHARTCVGELENGD